MLALLASLLLAAACGGDTAAGSGQVRGMVVEVVDRNITDVEVLTIRDDAGRVWTFATDPGFTGFTPSHLREHQLMGLSVLVDYETRGDSLVAVNIRD